MYYRTITVFFVFLFSTFISYSSYATSKLDNEFDKNPHTLVKYVSALLVSELKKIPNDENKEKRVQALIADTLFSYIDRKYISYSILGKYLKKATKAQREGFHKAMKSHLIKVYTTTLLKFEQQEIVVAQSNLSFQDKKKISIETTIHENNRPPVSLHFKLRKHKKTGSWKIYDFVVEGISLLDAKRKEFSKVLQSQGIDKTILKLKAN